MGLFHSPSIVRDGLVLCLDAANPKSYPGSGTTWYDLSGNSNHASMYGTVDYLTSNNGCWDFTSLTATSEPNSSSSPLGFTFSSSVISLTSSITLIASLYQTQGSSQPGLFAQNSYNPVVSGIRFGITGSNIYYGVGPTWQEGNLGNFPGGSLLNRWIILTVVYDRTGELGDGTKVYGYINGVLVGSASLPPQDTMTSVNPGIVRSTCCNRVPCLLSVVNGYNRALSAAEIAQNFAAHRGRYGI